MEKAISNTFFNRCRIIIMVVIAVITVWMCSHFIFSANRIERVILISIDTCRADYLSCYGYQDETTPNIDELAKEGILFKNTISPIPLTLPGHASMLTGTIPPYHGIHDNTDYKLGLSNVTLTEILKESGFATAAFISSFMMDSQFGLDQGFDSYSDIFEKTYSSVGINERKGGETSRLAAQWLDTHKDESFFLFLHYFDPHKSYKPPEPFASKFSQNLYAGEIAYTDACIGQVITRLKELGLYDSTLIIITGDHGEMLGEHGELTHSFYIYQGAIKVPLIFKLPGRSLSQTVSAPVGLIDIVPTVCSLLGIKTPPEVQGMDLSAYLQGKPPSAEKRYLYCESFIPTEYKANSLMGVVTDKYKYIQTTRPELYDLANDPAESRNLVTSQPQMARVLKDRLAQILEGSVRDDTSDSRLALDTRGLENLKSLGYVSTSISVDFEFAQILDDPKDVIGFHKVFLEIHRLLREEEYDRARILCEKILPQRPEFMGIQLAMAQIAIDQQQYSEAISHLQEPLRLEPDNSIVHHNMGVALVGLNRFEESIRHLEEALRLRPENPESISALGVALSKQGKIAQAAEYLSKALRLDPVNFDSHKNFGMFLLEHGKTQEAMTHFNQMQLLKPDKADVPHKLGVLLAQHGKLALVEGFFKRAIELNPDHAQAHHMLGVALLQMNRSAEAVEHLKISLSRRPEKPEMLVKIGSALALEGKLSLAADYFSKASEINPQMPQARYHLAQTLVRLDKIAPAVLHYQKLLELNPDQPEVLNTLAWLMATSENQELRNPQEAVQLAKHACELTKYKQPALLDTLAVAYAAKGDFPNAIETAEKAIELAESAGRRELADRIRKRIESYKAGRIF